MYGCRPRLQDLDLHTTKRAKKQKRETIRDKRAKVAHAIATNIDPSTQAWHRAHKHIDLSINMARSLKTCGSKHKHEKEPKNIWI